MKNRKKSALKYLIELSIVAFGVVLGLMVSECRSKIKIKENVQNSRALIINELEANLTALTNAVNYHQKIKNGFDSLKTDIPTETLLLPYFPKNKFRHEEIPGWNGLGIVNIEDVAFESAKIGSIFQHMDIDEIEQISSIYRELHNLSNHGSNIKDKFLSMNSDTKILDVVGVLEMVIGEYLNNERHLKTELEKTIQKLNK